MAHEKIFTRSLMDLETHLARAEAAAEVQMRRDCAQMRLAFALRVNNASIKLVQAKEAEMQSKIDQVSDLPVVSRRHLPDLP